MPLYEYQCTACGHRFEVIQKFSDKPLEKCPKCDQAIKRLVSTPAIQFKGTGWYVTDYAKRSLPADSKSEPKAAKDGTPANSDKSEKVKETATPSPATPGKRVEE